VDSRDAQWAAGGLSLFVFLSSFLGLSARYILSPGEAFAGMAIVWGGSAIADIVCRARATSRGSLVVHPIGALTRIGTGAGIAGASLRGSTGSQAPSVSR